MYWQQKHAMHGLMRETSSLLLYKEFSVYLIGKQE